MRSLTVFMLLAGLVFTHPPIVVACPMCKAAVAEDRRLPQAFQTSILFMLSVPAALCGSIVVGMVRLVRREDGLLAGQADSGAEHVEG